MTPIPPARFVWNTPEETGRTAMRLFRLRVDLAAEVTEALIHVFADSLYRLSVNGAAVNYGPARFIPSHPEHDTLDLAPHLRAGENWVLVEVLHRGAPCYQAMPEARAGFIAWGEIRSADGRSQPLATPGAWQVAVGRAWDTMSEPFSFAQGPIEICDRRLLPQGAGDWSPVVPVAQPEHWGALRPRSLPLPSMRRILPETIRVLAPVCDDRRRAGFRAPILREREAAQGPRLPLCTHLHSEREQTIELGLFWGPFALNGAFIHAEPCDTRGNYWKAQVRLQAGWNFLYAEPEVLGSAWPVFIEVPRDVRLAADPENPARGCFLHGPEIPERAFAGEDRPSYPRALSELPQGGRSWTAVAEDRCPPCPARNLAWDRTGKALLEKVAYRQDLEIPCGPERDVTLVLDLGREYLGHPWLDVDAPAGTIIDLGYDERLRPDGTIHYYKTHFWVNTAERFIARGERAERIECFHERGGRYLQLTFRAASGPVRLRQAGVRLTTVEVPVEGTFDCADPVFNWSWLAGQATLQASMSDGWIDPWRERGLYLGDAKVEAHATRAFTRDWSMERWALRLWAQGQGADGQLLDVVPSSHDYALYDYTLIWVLMARDFWAASGDHALARELWPTVLRIFASPCWQEHASGLWDLPDQKRGHLFVDWGVEPEGRRGVNGVLNAFRYAALCQAAEMARAIGEAEAAASLTREAARVRAAFNAELWDPARQCYAACLLEGKRPVTPGLHTNVLALAYGIPETPEQTAGALRHVEAGLARNIEGPDGNLELYFLYFVLEALYRHGRTAVAETVVREHYGKMKQLGAWTFWEALARGHLGIGSQCHGWASGPMVFFHSRILGVQPEPGRPERVHLRPQAETLDWARGRVPHALGLIEVEWRVRGGRLILDARVPAGVELVVDPVGPLATLPRTVRVR